MCVCAVFIKCVGVWNVLFGVCECGELNNASFPNISMFISCSCKMLQETFEALKLASMPFVCLCFCLLCHCVF